MAQYSVSYFRQMPLKRERTYLKTNCLFPFKEKEDSRKICPKFAVFPNLQQYKFESCDAIVKLCNKSENYTLHTVFPIFSPKVCQGNSLKKIHIGHGSWATRTQQKSWKKVQMVSTKESLRPDISLDARATLRNVSFPLFCRLPLL